MRMNRSGSIYLDFRVGRRQPVSQLGRDTHGWGGLGVCGGGGGGVSNHPASLTM